MNAFSRLLRQFWMASPDGSAHWEPVSESRLEELKGLSKSLGYEFRFPLLLDRALTHKSCFSEPLPGGMLRTRDYENLEFLGDAILDFVISEYLLGSFPDRTEGELTKMRASLVSARQLHRLSSRLELGRYLRLGKGEEKTGGRQKQAILADLFESLVAAIYLDGGISPVRRFVRRHVEELMKELASGELNFADYKSRLQELLHARGIQSPTYETLDESGPEHQKIFSVAVLIAGKRIAVGTGKSKKEAAQQAAGKAIRELTA